ncbi:MAG: polysaccharide deacetylase family protein [Sumerlaeia bacterium]
MLYAPNPILMYHHIASAPSDAGKHHVLYVPRHEFAAQLDALQSMGYKTVTSTEYQKTLAAQNSRQKVVWITFDDGFLNNYEVALPELQARGMVATFFVVVNRTLVQPEAHYMTPQMLLNLEAAGMEVASHTLSHPRLSNLPEPDILQELQQSRTLLEAHLGKPQPAFCFPYGDHNRAVLSAVQQAGYSLSVSTIRGNKNTEADRWRLKRIMIGPGRTGGKFRYSFTPLYHLLHQKKNASRWKLT